MRATDTFGVETQIVSLVKLLNDHVKAAKEKGLKVHISRHWDTNLYEVEFHKVHTS